MAAHAVALVAGGTGGHIAPALGLAEELHRRGYACTFLTGDRGVERCFPLPEEWGAARLCRSPRWPGSFLGLPGYARRLWSAAGQARAVLLETEAEALIAFGGYVCVGPAVAAWRLGLPVILVEQNVLPGRAARLVSRWATRVLCHWEEAAEHLVHPDRARAVGTPLRPGLLSGSRASGLAGAGLAAGRRTVLILGGSQGAHRVNELVVEGMKALGEYGKQLQFLHQTGPEDADWVRDAYGEAGVPACVEPFFDNMPDLFRAADLVVSRAGGSTIAEVAAFGLPAVFIPYPHATEAHQMANARAQEKVGAAMVFEEEDLLPGTVAEVWIALVEESSWVGDLARCAFRTAKPDAAMAAARQVEDVLAGNGGNRQAAQRA
jgi:UDP-N-acetylglucosamine--N-acetylmuramyl-(pentapeptide) pyrophosphoryl-undecaprenol N-acetylglucosamine transferase